MRTDVCRVLEWWAEGFDLLVIPTMTQLPPTLDEREPKKLTAAFGLLTMPFSLTGQPAISLPLYRSEDALPVGVQLVADYSREDLLIRIAAQLEEAQP
jgi:amidase